MPGQQDQDLTAHVLKQEVAGDDLWTFQGVGSAKTKQESPGSVRLPHDLGFSVGVRPCCVTSDLSCRF